MEVPKTALRHDVMQKWVNHQIQEFEDRATAPSALDALFNSERNHDLIGWPRPYLEAFLDLDESGHVPLTPGPLQDVLEAAVERDEALAIEFLKELEADNGPQSLPDSTIQMADARTFDWEHRGDLLFDRADAEDFLKLSARIAAVTRTLQQVSGTRNNGRPTGVLRRETTSIMAEHTPGSGIIQIHDQVAGTDLRKLLGQVGLPAETQWARKEVDRITRINHALTDSRSYRGAVVAETAQDLIQRINPQSAVVHRKANLALVPAIGEYFRIVYSNGVGQARQARERSRNQELAR